MTVFHVVLIALTLYFALSRILGAKGKVYKAFAHCFVGFLSGGWYVARQHPEPLNGFYGAFTQADLLGLLFVFLAAVEVVAFLVTRLLKRAL